MLSKSLNASQSYSRRYTPTIKHKTLSLWFAKDMTGLYQFTYKAGCFFLTMYSGFYVFICQSIFPIQTKIY